MRRAEFATRTPLPDNLQIPCNPLATQASTQLLHGGAAVAHQRLRERLLLQLGQRGDHVEFTHVATEPGDTTQLSPMIDRSSLFEHRPESLEPGTQTPTGHPDLVDVGLVGKRQARQVTGQYLLVTPQRPAEP